MSAPSGLTSDDEAGSGRTTSLAEVTTIETDTPRLLVVELESLDPSAISTDSSSDQCVNKHDERKEMEEDNITVNKYHNDQSSLLQADLPIDADSDTATTSDNVSLSVRADSHWSSIPTELIFLFCRYLDGRSLTQLQQCDRISSKVTRSREIWMHLVANTNTNPRLAWKASWIDTRVKEQIEQQIGLSETKCPPRTHVENPMKTLPEHFDPFEYYKKRYKATLSLRIQAIKDQERRKIPSTGTRSELKVRWIEEVLLPIVAMILFVIFFTLLIHELDSTNSSPQVTFTTFGWLLALVGLLSLSLLVTFYRRWRYSLLFTRLLTDDDNAILSNRSEFTNQEAASYFRNSKSHVWLFIHWVEASNGFDATTFQEANQRKVLWVHLTLVVASLGVAAWLVMIALKCTGTILTSSSSSWTLVFIPLYLTYFLIFYGRFILSWFSTSRSITQMLMFWVILLPIVMVSILVNVYLVSREWNIHLVLMTLYILHAVIFIFTLLWMLIYCGRNTANDILNGVRRAPTWIDAPLIWLGIFAPLLIFQLLLAFKIEKTYELSWIGIFCPLFLPLLILYVNLLYSCSERNLQIGRDKRWIDEKREACERIEKIFEMPCV